jgi:hypothetical protein
MNPAPVRNESFARRAAQVEKLFVKSPSGPEGTVWRLAVDCRRCLAICLERRSTFLRSNLAALATEMARCRLPRHCFRRNHMPSARFVGKSKQQDALPRK